MTPKEFAEKMKEIAKFSDDDPEIAHGDADALIVQVLKEYGYQEGLEIFIKMDKWYA